MTSEGIEDIGLLKISIIAMIVVMVVAIALMKGGLEKLYQIIVALGG